MSNPSPAPAPKGEVPRATSKTVTVPKKEWSGQGTKEPRGLGGAGSAQKDWNKTGASKQPVTPPKDWSKKAEPTKAAKARPRAPSKDFDR